MNPGVFGALALRRCPLCGSGDDARVYAAANIAPGVLDSYAFASRKLPEYMHYRLVACPLCDLVYASPAPREETLAAAYQDAAYDSVEEARFAARTYARFLPTIGARLPSQVGLLDIGAGDGAFLRRALRAGFSQVKGVEPSAAPIAAAPPGVRRLIRQGIFRVEDYAPGSFSLITLFQTVEHLHDPLAVCADIYTLLREGGALFIICHNRNALSARLLGRRSPIFDVEHMQLFSARSLNYMLRRAGFGAVELHTVYNRYPLNYWFRLFPFSRAAKQRLLTALQRTGVGRAPVALPAGNIAAIAYKLPGGRS